MIVRKRRLWWQIKYLSPRCFGSISKDPKVSNGASEFYLLSANPKVYVTGGLGN